MIEHFRSGRSESDGKDTVPRLQVSEQNEITLGKLILESHEKTHLIA